MDRAGVPPRQGPGMLDPVPPLSAFLIGLSALTGLMALEIPEATLLAFPGDESVPGGTAVVVGPGLAVTLTEALPTGEGPWRLQRFGGGTVEGRLVRRGASGIAVLEVPADLPALAMAPREPALGATVWTVGNAAGAIALDGRPARSRGVVSGSYILPGGPVRGRGGQVISTWQGPVWEVDAAINDGLQGGAVVDDTGHLVALVTLAVARERRLGCVVPWRVVAAELGRPGPTPATPTAQPPWLATVAFQRPQAPPANLPRPERTVDQVPPYERDRLQQQWDLYWHSQQVGRTDQPVPALVLNAKSGLLLTAAGNLHGGAVGGIVTRADGQQMPVTVRAVDLPLDLALLQGPGWEGPAFTGRAAPLTLGDPVAVLGTAGTRTVGVVSAVDRRLAQSDVGFLQVDARANFGSLGGVVTDANGAVAGLIVHLGPEQPWLINSGVTLAVDGPTIAAALPALVAGKSRDRLPVLGLGVQLQEEADGLNIVAVVPGTGAADAGLLPGDVLAQVAGRPATSRAAVARALVKVTPGTAVPVVIQRGRSTFTVAVVVRSFGR